MTTRMHLLAAVLLSTGMPGVGSAQLRFDGADPPPETSQFDFLLGDWTFDAVWHLPNGEQRAAGTWTARKGLDGFAVVDEWRILNRETGAPVYIGASTRTFNPRTDRWEWTFLDVFNARREEQFGEWRDGEMHLWWNGTDANGREYRMRVRYYDITPDSFLWSADRSYDGGATWIRGWLTMRVVRRG